MKKSKKRFEYEVHLGLLVIVFLLLCLNFISNFIIYRARDARRETTQTIFTNAAIAINRMLPESAVAQPTESEHREILQQYRLSSFHIINTFPADPSLETRRLWFVAIAQMLPADQLPELAQKLLSSRYQNLTRGKDNEYFYVTPLTKGSGRSLLILSKNIPDLAFLDDSHRLVVIVGLAAIFAIGIVYFLLSRFIITPFRRIKKVAIRAGRLRGNSEDDVDGVVTEYKEIIDELRDKEQQLLKLNEEIQNRADSFEHFNQFLLESSSSGIITTDIKGRVMTVNSAAATMLHLDDSSLAGCHFTDIFPSESMIGKSLIDVLSTGTNTGYHEVDYQADDNRTVKLGVIITSIRDGAGNLVGVSLLMNDLTEIVQLRADLETKKRLAALGEMAGGLAHQLRNSLGAVSGYALLLKKRMGKRGFDDPSITELLQETDEAEKLTERFLHFARPLACNPLETSLRELIEDVIDTFQMRPDCRNIEFSIHLKGDLMAQLDPLLFRQALINLIENAVYAYPDGKGSVELSIESSETEIAVIIRDFGCGIGTEDIDQIFTPFFSSRPSGTGLGLPLAAKIVDLHNGRISVESEPKVGTTFKIFLPLTHVESHNGSLSEKQEVLRT